MTRKPWGLIGAVLALALALALLLRERAASSQAADEARTSGSAGQGHTQARTAPASPAALPGSAEPGRDAAVPAAGPKGTVDAGSAAAAADGSVGARPADARAGLDAWLKRNAAEAEQNVDDFCEEAKTLQRDPVQPTGRHRDASSYLTVRIDWEDGVRPPGLLHLPEALRARLKGYGDAWPSAITDADLLGLDFSWWADLHQFDEWNLLAEGPLREAREHDFYTAPIPNFTELGLWTKLLLARAMRTGDFAGASADLHQLVALIRTTGTVIGDMYSVLLLNLERQGLEAAAAAGLAVPPGLAYTADETAHERHVGRAAMYFFYPGVSDEVMKKAFACNTRFRCPALIEGVAQQVVSAAPENATLASLLAESGCNPDMVQWMRRATPRPLESVYEALPPAGVLQRTLKP